MSTYEPVPQQAKGLPDLIEDTATFRGYSLHILASISNGPLGYFLRNFLAKKNLIPIEEVKIEESFTFYPFSPPESLECPTSFSLEEQSEFLKKKKPKTDIYATIYDYYNLYHQEKRTPTDIIKSVLKKALESKKENNYIFTQINEKAAKEAAQASTERYKEKKQLSVLDGVPFVVKDEFDVEGLSTNGGRKQIQRINEESCDVVKTLTDMGAIVIGITNMHEMGMGVTGINPHNGTPRNPHNPKHVTGGSSSGSAVAVASGLVPFALGTDGGGSVRIPSAFCGICGIKPTFGRWSPRGTLAAKSTVTHAGVIATCVADAALITGILNNANPDKRFFEPARKAGRGLKNPDDSDDLVLQIPKSVFHRGPALDISVTKTKFGMFPLDGVDDEIKDAFMACLHELLPGEPMKLEVTEGYLSKMAHLVLITSETAQEEAIFQREWSDLTAQTRMMYAVCSRVTQQQYMKACTQKTRCMEMFRKMFEECHVILLPTTACLPKQIDPASLKYGELDQMNLVRTMWFVFFANLCGLPAITINMGYTSKKLPMGLMIMGPWWDEDRLFVVAEHLEQKMGELDEPKLWFDPVK